MTHQNESLTITKAGLRRHLATYLATNAPDMLLTETELDQCVSHIFVNELMIQQAEASRCPECENVRPGDDRVAAGMKCGVCSYGY